MEVDTNKDRDVGGRRPRAEYARGVPIARPVAANRSLQMYEDDLEEEDEIWYERRQPQRRGGKCRGRYRSNYHGYDYEDGNDFRLKVGIPYFNGNLDIEEILDWLAEVDRFFNYMEIPEKRKVKMVVCQLKGGASIWWERLQTKRYRDGRQPVRTWFHIKQLL